MPIPKYTPEYRVFLSSVVVDCMTKEAADSKDQVLQDAAVVAKQHLRTETENAKRALQRAGSAGEP